MPEDNSSSISPNSFFKIEGIKQNNLKNLDLNIEHNKLVVLSGLSGSGKSSLAFECLHAEAGRRYIETFSPYTRQFLDKLTKPDIEHASGLRPSLALEQNNRTTNSRSTVGSLTEINEYLKLIWLNLSETVCPKCSTKISSESPAKAYTKISSYLKKSKPEYLALGFQTPFSGSASIDAFKETLISQGFLKYFNKDSDEILNIANLSENLSQPFLEIVLKRIKTSAKNTANTEFDKETIYSLRSAMNFGHGNYFCLLVYKDKIKKLSFSSNLDCKKCGYKAPAKSSGVFSYNSPLGACEDCRGFGYELCLNVDACIQNPNQSIKDGAISCWETKAKTITKRKLLEFCKKENISINTPWSNLNEKDQEKIIKGHQRFKGLNGWYEHLKKKQYKMHIRVQLAKFRKQVLCSGCSGHRLKKSSLNFKIKNKNLADIWSMPISKSLVFFEEILLEEKKDLHLETILKEAISRLGYLNEIGLSYLSLNRPSKTLSGGEAQRVSLTSILGAGLTNCQLVLDEPTIGLHATDTWRLIESFKRLRDKGNSLVVVEHDPQIIKEAEEIIDLGPESGKNGGNIIHQGSLKKLLKNKSSLTAKYLNSSFVPKEEDQENIKKKFDFIEIKGANAHNLKSINLSLPINTFTTLCGVSGSGKTSLTEHCIYKPFIRHQKGLSQKLSLLDDVTGFEKIDDIIRVDQSPIGKTPRSNPATYTKAWDVIRNLLSETSTAEKLGLSKSAFSFNTEGGRCTDCKGAGYHRVEMQFLADVFVLCESCQGERFQKKILDVKYQNKNVIDFLNMTILECSKFFKELGQSKDVIRCLKPLLDLELGYLKLGHPLNKLSGGEAQRLKLASFLKESLKETQAQNNLFILDEPSTGLHPYNVESLITVFRKLRDAGHGVLVIEHNLEIIQASDFLIELGPEGGDNGGKVVLSGPTKKFLENKFLNSKKASLSPTLGSIKRIRKESSLSTSENKKQKKLTVSNEILIKGAKQNNLNSIDVSIPQNKLVAVTGVSGSGKSTLAFEILFSEGQRRYIDCLSPYARQFLKQTSRADVDRIENLPPTIAVSQRTSHSSGLSTVGTSTDIYGYLRLLFSKTGLQHCPKHNLAITKSSAEEIADSLILNHKEKRIFFFASVITGKKGYHKDVFRRAIQAEISEARIDGKVRKIDETTSLERHKLHWISLLVSSLKCSKSNRALIIHSIQQCLALGNGEVEVSVESSSSKPLILNDKRLCPKCKQGFRALDPQDFSFSSKRGACKKCYGMGKSPSSKKTCTECQGSRINSFSRNVLINKKSIFDFSSLNSKELLKELKKVKFDKRLNEVVTPIFRELNHRLSLINEVGLDYLSLDRDSSTISGGEAQRLRLLKALGSPLSGVCYVFDEPTIGLHSSEQKMLVKILKKLKEAGNTVIVVEHDEELIREADHVIDIGPKAGVFGGNLVYSGAVKGLLKCKESLTSNALNESKSESKKIKSKLSKLNKKQINEKNKAGSIIIKNADANNLKSISAEFKLEKLNLVCGVSGAGKSSLVHECLIPALQEYLSRPKLPQSKKAKLKLNTSNIELNGSLDSLLIIDQTPLGKTSTSTPASYLGVMPEIRKLYAKTNDALVKGWGDKHFSFNTGKGRCENCSGKGFLKIPMQFLADAFNPCEVCFGKRYDSETEEILYKGISIGTLLEKNISESLKILENHPKISKILKCANDLGLGYISLGQASYTLSGGEAQRLKIARELAKKTSKKNLYVLDEPTIGLHMKDVGLLSSVLLRLVDSGHTVIVIEHNLDFTLGAQHLLEIGPGPAEKGGKLLYSGALDTMLNSGRIKTPTKTALQKHLGL